MASERLLLISGEERRRLLKLDAGMPMAETVALLMLHQMAAVARSQVLLAEARCIPETVHSPATALSRLVTEGLIYMNYLLAEDCDWRAHVYAMGDSMMREKYELNCDGLSWTRKHGPKPPRPPDSSLRATFVRLTCKPGEVDDFEAQWILHHMRILASIDPSLLGRMSVKPGQRFRLDKLRGLWNRVGTIVSDTAKPLWKAARDQWNLLPSWPFGLRPREAEAAGHLEARLTEAARRARILRATTVAQHLEWIRRLGLDLNSDLAHLSPARVFLTGSGFVDPALASSLAMLYWTCRLLSDDFVWTPKARKAVPWKWPRRRRGKARPPSDFRVTSGVTMRDY
jgi:hypothetical protein